MRLRENVGRFLARMLARHPLSERGEQPQPVNWRDKLVHALDERFNLRYLADRLQHEQRVIDSFLGQPRPSPNGSSVRISIVTPVYGIKPRYVRAFVRSIRRQAYTNWELCVCVDGDPDTRVQRLLERFQRRDPDRFRLVVHTRNQGISLATKSALQLSSGEIIAFADSDDVLHRDAVAVLAGVFSAEEDVDLAYTNSDILTPWGYRIDPLYKPGWSPELLLFCNYVMHIVAVRRSLLDRSDLRWEPAFDGAQDWNTMLHTTQHARRIHHIPIVLYHWRALESSTANALDVKPWARTAAKTVQDNYLEQRDPRLQCPDDGDAIVAPLAFKTGQAPPLHVLQLVFDADSSIEKSATTEVAYSAMMHRTTVRLPDTFHGQVDALNEAVNALPNGESFILFLCTDADAALEGPVDAMVALAALPGVACVWPFFHLFRGAYTVDHGQLVPRTSRSSYFTPLTGNVLTGPLHGLVTRRDVWQQLNGFGTAAEQTLPAQRSPQALGATFGLRALERGLRNVAVRDVTCDWLPPGLDLGAGIPDQDPYI